MIKNIYSVLDRVTGTYGHPIMFEASLGGGHVDAQRWFVNSLKDIGKVTGDARTAADFALYFIGSFGQVMGTIKAEEKPMFLACPGEGLEVKGVETKIVEFPKNEEMPI